MRGPSVTKDFAHRTPKGRLNLPQEVGWYPFHLATGLHLSLL